ncbi:GspE/PulE family protein [Verrucomicrobium sp. 3C]|uniref:GspE/PulE family protein n=1 Tax=Verrucomicrobium sp. 3C TaxID=1134055 RepID=UPI001E2D34B7|nr:ATPase, T2SS/T4P/T4SS family [Verrucomicrobium sp. 3C]
MLHELQNGGAIPGGRFLDPDRQAEKALLEAKIPSERWVEALSRCNLPSFLPADGCRPGREETPKELVQEWAVVLMREPAVLIGCLNPFRLSGIMTIAPVLYPNKLWLSCLLTPQTWKAVESGESGASVSTDSLLRASGWPPELYPSPSDVLASLHKSEAGLAIPQSWLSPARLLRCGGILIWETETMAWVATDRFANGRFRSDAIAELMGKRPILLSQGSEELAVLRSRLPATNHHAKVAGESLSMTHWPATKDQDVLFRTIMSAAIRSGSSDVLATPLPSGRCRIRFAIGGEWVEQACITGDQHRELLIRAKTVGEGMKPDLTCLPQDGDGQILIDGELRRLRLSVLPLEAGNDQLAVRIHEDKPRKLRDLRLPERVVSALRWFLGKRHGLFMAIGPTGSGKTTLLYAMLLEIVDEPVHLITIEDPPERRFAEASQTRAGVISYSELIKSSMRQFPQAMLVGEIRDQLAAQKCVEAALTGHKVLTSIHASDPAQALMRMQIGFGIDRSTIANATKLCVSQGLAPRLCRHCKEVRQATAEEVAVFPDVELPSYQIAERRGCIRCRWTGIENGMERIPIFEVLPVDSHIRALLTDGASAEKIRRHNRERGYPTIDEEAARLAFSGEIEIKEAARFLDLPPAAGQKWIGA